MAPSIKMPVGSTVVLDPTDIMLDRDPAPSPQKRGQSQHIFSLCLFLPNGCMDQNATRYTPRPRNIMLDGNEATLPKRGRSPPPTNFRPMSIVPKRLDGSKCHLARS